MLEILLLILKLLCYFILILLGVVVLLLCVLLFVPIRYTSDGYKREEEWKVYAKITFLSPVLRIKVLYPSEQAVTTRICGFVYKKKDKPETKAETQKGKVDSQEKISVPSKKKRKHSFIKDIEYYQKLWQNEKDLILDVLTTAIDAIATILPKDFQAKVIYGTGAADITGFIYAIYCALQSYLPEDVYIEPVWTEQYLEGEYKLRGRIRLFPLVVALIKIIANKNVRILYKKLRRV